MHALLYPIQPGKVGLLCFQHPCLQGCQLTLAGQILFGTISASGLQLDTWADCPPGGSGRAGHQGSQQPEHQPHAQWRRDQIEQAHTNTLLARNQSARRSSAPFWPPLILLVMALNLP